MDLPKAVEARPQRSLTLEENWFTYTHGPSMDAPILRYSLVTLSLFISTGASFKTPNFTVTAPTAEIAQTVGEAAEVYRRDLAKFWLDQPLPNWSKPCKLRVRPGSMGAGGETRFQFVGGEVLNWDMYVQGSMERILDSVLPHEVNHTIFACHFRRPLPRWADEGAATLFEHRSEQVKQLGLLNQVINSDREFLSLNKLLTMKEYPKGYRPMLIMYSEGYALADFLVQQGGRKKYLQFLDDGHRLGWTKAIKKNYHHGGVESLESNWKGWVLAGMPKLKLPEGEMLASAETIRAQDAARPTILDEYQTNTTVRSQSPDALTRSAADRERTRSSKAALPERKPVRRTPARTTEAVGTMKRAGYSHVAPRNSMTTSISDAANRPTTSGQEEAYRSSTFQAPAPKGTDNTVLPQKPPVRSRSVPGSPIERSSRTAPVSRRGFEPTGVGFPARSSKSQNQRKHLPQERNVVTGSTPQWAGFPRQKELF